MKFTANVVLTLTLAGQAHIATAAATPDEETWSSLLKQYVNASALVDYRALKQGGLARLDSYLSQVAAKWPETMTPPARKAALINAYNALTVRWIATNYPVASIRGTDNPFRAARHVVDGRKMSLDQVEALLRDMKDPRIHAALVCAGMSCPPLRREAYVENRINEQLDDNVRAWLANPRLNEFQPDRKLASVSSIFKWYVRDFDSAGGLVAFLAKYAPRDRAEFLPGRAFRLEFKKYDWSLNDASTRNSK